MMVLEETILASHVGLETKVKALKVITLVVLMVLNGAAFGALYVEGRVVYEIVNQHTH